MRDDDFQFKNEPTRSGKEHFEITSHENGVAPLVMLAMLMLKLMLVLAIPKTNPMLLARHVVGIENVACLLGKVDGGFRDIRPN